MRRRLAIERTTELGGIWAPRMKCSLTTARPDPEGQRGLPRGLSRTHLTSRLPYLIHRQLTQGITREEAAMKKGAWTAVGAVAIFGIWATCCASSSGQQPPPQVQRSTVNVVRIKPDMVDAWLDFQEKRTIPALKKAGVAQRDVYQSAYGPLGEFRIVTPIGKFADRDNPSPIERALGAEGVKTYNAELRKMIASGTTYVIQAVPEASFDPNPNATYKILVLQTSHVAPGRRDDFLGYVRNDLLPVQQKGQVKRFLVSRVIFGGDSVEYRLATFVEKFADLDAGSAVVRVLGQDGAAKLAQKTAGIVTSIQTTVYVRNDALSFRPRPTS